MGLPSEAGQWVLLHNPRCSKSRATLALLEDRGIEVEVRRYLESPLDRDELVELGRRLGLGPSGFVRTGESEYAGVSGTDDGGLFDAMVAHPILMQRPVLCGRDAAAIGRPPEAVLELLD